MRAPSGVRWVWLALLALSMAGCNAPAPNTPKPRTGVTIDSRTKGFPGAEDVRDSVYDAIERGTSAPEGYGLYTFVLTRSANRNAVRLLSEIFATTGGAGDAAMARENLNLMLIPVKDHAQAAQVMASARDLPGPSATTLMQKSYDFGQAAALLASVCHPTRGAAVMKACGSTAPDGPILVTTQRPITAAATPGQRLLLVNLGNASPEAMGEIVAAYRRQITRKDFADRAEVDGWRLTVLNVALDASHLLPGLSKAYAGGK